MTWMLSGRPSTKCRNLTASLFVVALLFLLASCKTRSGTDSETNVSRADQLELTFTYGSEKEKWINDVTNDFNRSDHRTSSGKHIFVRTFAMGSGEAIDEIVEGRRQPHIVSPASAAFIKLGNAQSQSKFGKDLIASPIISFSRRW